MQIVHAAGMAWAEKQERHREGSLAFKNLFAGEEGDPNNFRLVLSRNSGEYKSPFHRHNFDQVRYCVQGAANIAPGKTLEQGDIGFFPEGTPYGPQYDIGQERITLVLQGGGASGLGYMSSAQLRRGTGALEKIGVFGGGNFRRHGGNEERDSYEAIWEYINDRPIDYPGPRYAEPILIRTASFAWKPDPSHKGLARRALGSFTERGTRLDFLKLEEGGQASLGEAGAMQLVFVVNGEGVVTEENWKTHTAMRLDDETADISATAPSEVLLITLPIIR